jgi:Fe-S oxidoreductase
MRRTVEALAPLVRQGLPVIGLEPACLFTLRDEFLAVLPGVQTERLAESAVTFEEFLSRERNEGRLRLDLNPTDGGKALLHGHCHQKAFAAMSPVEQVLGLVPGLEVETVESSCCGMAGAFGYAAETYDVSLRMAELSLLPAVRAADPDTLVVADGVSCRQQIAHGAGRPALHCARVLERALAPGTG